jgi:intraflagellar transport protein 52
LKMDHITFVIEMYKRLNVPYEPLTLVEPHFECPQPSLRMATHPPQMIAPPPPALELFDLDESFLDIRTRLQKAAAKFNNHNDLEYFVEEAGSIVSPNACADVEWRLNGIDSSKHLLHHVARKVCSF